MNKTTPDKEKWREAIDKLHLKNCKCPKSGVKISCYKARLEAEIALFSACKADTIALIEGMKRDISCEEEDCLKPHIHDRDRAVNAVLDQILSILRKEI